MHVDPPNPERPLALVEGSGRLTDIDTAQVESLFRDYGALMLRGFDRDPADFESFAQRLCPTSVFNESPGRTALDEGSALQTVNLGADAFPLHPELSREPWRPDACLFYCMEPDSEGGQTTVCDGTAIVDRLPAEIRNAMMDRRLFYMRPASPKALRYWLGTEFPTDDQLANPPSGCPYWFRRAGPRIVRGFARPLLHRPNFTDRLAFGNFLLFARDYMRVSNVPVLDTGEPVPDRWMQAVREAAAPITYEIPWTSGDLVVIDNSRFMHGRRAIRDAANRRIASYFGYVSFAPPSPYEPVDPIWRRETFHPPETMAN